MRKYLFTLMLVATSLSAQTPPTWFKVAKVGDVVTSASSAIYQVGLTSVGCWTLPFSGAMTRFSTTWGNLTNVYKVTEPCPAGSVDEIDVQETSVEQFFIVNNSVVVVPILNAPPPPPPAPAITLSLTINPVPVILNGTKYSCTSVVLDNTGTLTLTC